MKLKTLKMLVKLIEKGSYSAVADELGMTQPAISIQIKTLEEFFAVELVIRQKGKMKLTPAGKVVYRQAKEILNHWEQTILEVEQIKGEIYGQLIIGASTIPSEYLLPELLVDFQNKFSEVKVLVQIGDSKEVIDKLKNREVDVVIVGTIPQKKQFEVIPIIEDHLTCILPKGHRLVNKSMICIKDLEEERILIREEGSGTRRALLAGLNEAGISMNDLNIMTNLGSTEAIISGVEAGLGISFVSELAAIKAVKNGRVEKIKLVDMLISRKLYLAYPRERKDELLIKEFTKIF